MKIAETLEHSGIGVHIVGAIYPPSAMATFLIGGYYSLLVEPGLRLIVLNTNFYDAYDPYAHLLLPLSDPGGQLAWLEATLENATLANEKVFVAAHVAPGMRSSTGRLDVVDFFNDRYIRIIQHYYSIIAGQFFGHWHRDEFKVFRDEQSAPISVAWLASSVTPFHDVNPSVRMYSYDEVSKNVLDYSVWWVNLTEANAAGEITWEFEYSPFQVYHNLTDMSPASWLKVADTYLANSTLFDTYYRLHTVGCPVVPCRSRDCQKKQYCAAVQVDDLHYHECVLFE